MRHEFGQCYSPISEFRFSKDGFTFSDLLGPQETGVQRIEVSQEQAAEPDFQLAFFCPLEAYLPARQAPTQEYLLLLPTKLPVFVH